ncbi:LTA synthase family protein [Fulvimonas sp. R45]|uniref:LTA synthase family protein n=1 Tax=Fulvimonas sp. R45 TaxID=3045937 RepID=UPI00265F5E7F|nr:LTA synthase family protein [Fulvimonas sp. R45]MDO1527642.1 LTA synthase family protein [Fulvimonas sp. R45]
MKSHLYRVLGRAALLSCAILVFICAVAVAALREPEALEKGFVFTLLACITGLLLFALGRPATALLLGGGSFLLLKFISSTKLRYLESPLMPADFVYFARTSLMETLEHYPHLLRLGVAACILVPLLVVFVWRADYSLFPRLRGWSRTSLRVAGAVACALAFWICLLPGGPFKAIYEKGLWNKLSDQAHLTNFFITIRDSAIHMPPMSDAATAERNWAASARSTGGTRGPYPDIVQVLEESTFDPSIFAGCDIPQCRVAMFEPDARTRGHGFLRTHTFGGGTWVSEFAALTGMPQDIFGPAGMYAPYVLAPRTHDTLPMLLRRLGYLTVVIYPTGGNFINARNAYQSYGFDQFYDVHDLGLQMWHTSDAQLFAAAKRVYDKVHKPGQPVFIMVLTLEQHGPHDTKPLSSLPAPFNQGLIHGLPADQALNLDTYLSRLHDSDEGMRQLEHDFLDRPDPTVLLHFGDHQPSFSGLIRQMKRSLPTGLEPYKSNLTYYMVKTNFATPPLPSYPMLDIAYLPSMVLEAASLPKDPYFSALTSFRDRCHGLYEDCADHTLTESYYAWIFGQLHELH